MCKMVFVSGAGSRTGVTGTNFDEQLALAKAKMSDKVYPGMWDSETHEPHVLESGMRKTGQDSMDQIFTSLEDPNFKDFVQESYSAPEGYAIRVNPVTGKKEMMVAGTRHFMQWPLNAYDSVLYGGDKAIKKGANWVFDHTVGDIPFLPHPHIKGVKLLEKADPWRQEKQKYYQEVAKAEGVDIVYGHSRGGALIADMKVPGVQKVGLDAAMLIAHDTGMLNINEGGGWNPMGLFDKGIGLTGEQNVHHDASFWSPHAVWKT